MMDEQKTLKEEIKQIIDDTLDAVSETSDYEVDYISFDIKFTGGSSVNFAMTRKD